MFSRLTNMKKYFVLLVGLISMLSYNAMAQNVQLHYDLGHSIYNSTDVDGRNLSARPKVTTTTEMFKADKFGSTFFFIDLDFNDDAVCKDHRNVGAQWEISREVNLWQNSSLSWLSAHFEYNGGSSLSTKFNNSWLVGPTYSGHSADFSKTWSLSLMYKYIPNTIGLDGGEQPHNFQITGVWGINFANGWCTFSGFLDFWKEARGWQNTEYILLAEPQFWVNLNAAPSMRDFNLSIGGEVEVSNNFVGEGFYTIPTIGAKWTF